MKKLIFWFVSICLADLAEGFPSNIRYGYTTCAACHVDATGGALLTPYGRMFAGEVLSTWGGKTEAGLLHGLVNTTDRLDIGGDFQHVSISSKDYERAFVMQREVQAGINYKRMFYLVGSIGLYGEEPKAAEMRKVYLEATDQKNWTFKMGRFFPAFGIMSNEHLYRYRNRYFNQGRETYNIEAIYRAQYFELTATKVIGHPDDFENGILKGKEGWASRVSITPTKMLNLGASYYVLIDPKARIEHYGAAHGLWALSQEFWLEGQAGLEDAYFRVGFAPTKGLMLRPTIEVQYQAKEKPLPELNIQWLPRPHFDLQLTCSKTTWVFLSHYYL